MRSPFGWLLEFIDYILGRGSVNVSNALVMPQTSTSTFHPSCSLRELLHPPSIILAIVNLALIVLGIALPLSVPSPVLKTVSPPSSLMGGSKFHCNLWTAPHPGRQSPWKLRRTCRWAAHPAQRQHNQHPPEPPSPPFPP
jgi:hypothetical protein